MPELPDILLYIEALDRLIRGKVIDRVELRSPFLLRSVEPGLSEAQGKQVLALRRLGKRIVWELEDDLFAVFHLMIAGRFHWRKPGAGPRKKTDLAAFHFCNGSLMLTEAGSRKRASLHMVRGEGSLAQHDPGGLEVLGCGL